MKYVVSIYYYIVTLTYKHQAIGTKDYECLGQQTTPPNDRRLTLTTAMFVIDGDIQSEASQSWKKQYPQQCLIKVFKQASCRAKWLSSKSFLNKSPLNVMLHGP